MTLDRITLLAFLTIGILALWASVDVLEDLSADYWWKE